VDHVLDVVEDLLHESAEGSGEKQRNDAASPGGFSGP
jgi:hypothetical protein